jgi:regulator of protease activity HflC (stomatin/prohibitin superfamily)
MLIVGVIAAVILALSGSGLFETNRAGQIQVKQAILTGNMTCKTTPGTYVQMFGEIHTYDEATTFYFTADSETGENKDQSLSTRFNDGSKAKVSGSVRIILPKSCTALVELHKKFRGEPGVLEELVLPAVRKALFNTGPHMSAAESYAQRRVEFAALLEDQLTNGVIMINKRREKQPDLITGEEKEVWVVTKRKCDKEGGKCIEGYIRDPSAFHRFRITATNLAIDKITYSKKVIKQIEQQRQARMDIITQQAQAKRAEARASKAEAEAKAQIAETRAEEEVEKTKRIVKAEADKKEATLLAEKRRDVSTLDIQTATAEKKANILRGEGEAARKRLVMAADGALEQKLKAWLSAQKAFASAIKQAKPGAIVPQVVMGGGGGGAGGNPMNTLFGVWAAKAAKDLSLDLSHKH